MAPGEFSWAPASAVKQAVRRERARKRAALAANHCSRNGDRKPPRGCGVGKSLRLGATRDAGGAVRQASRTQTIKPTRKAHTGSEHPCKSSYFRESGSTEARTTRTRL